ncbi:MAG: acetate--CoA ligase family protein [Chloroflexota bacterium]
MLDKDFFSPKSVALVGASGETGKLGFVVLKNILQHGFKGSVYPVNPTTDEIMGLRAYTRLTDIPGEVDLAVIIVPAQTVPGVMKDAGLKGVRSAVVISAGFRETGAEGARLEEEMLATARSYGARVLGPNCLGFIDTGSSLNATFAAGMALKGSVAFMSQSGALCQVILDWAKDIGLGFSKFVSLGNKADIDESDLLHAWREDEATSVVIAYLEDVSRGEDFRREATALTRVKPLILMKAGATAAGARAAASHTGALAGFDAAYNAAFRQSGAVRAGSMESLIDFSLAFAYQPIARGDRIAVVTNAGGPGIIAADACEKAGLRLSQLSKETIDRLRKGLPPTASIYNPVDVVGDASPDRYRNALEAVIRDPAVDGVLVLLTPQAVTDVGRVAQVVNRVSRNSPKPILASFMGGKAVAQGIRLMSRAKVPNYPFPERAVASFQAMKEYRNWLERKQGKPVILPVDRDKAGAILSRAKKERKSTLSDFEARELLGAYGFDLPRSTLAHSPEEAVDAANQIGYPVVMKIASPDILHKTDIGGVRLNLQSPDAVIKAYLEITEGARRFMPQAQITGIDVQEMVKGREVILGMNRNRTFGPLLMFGLGGIYVEVLKDVSFRLAPLMPSDAEAMISEIRGYPLLAGVRGEKPADIPALAEALTRLSQLTLDFPEITELDVNPLMVREVGKGTVALDCRMGISI